MTEPFGALLEGAQQIGDDSTQDLFQLSTNYQNMKRWEHELKCGSMSSEDVSAILDGQIEWEEGSKRRVISWLQHDVQKLIPPGQSTLPIFSLKELQDKQQEDAVLLRVIHSVTCGRRPSRREQVKEPYGVRRTLKQWDK